MPATGASVGTVMKDRYAKIFRATGEALLKEKRKVLVGQMKGQG
jgi:hypothetical protein